VHWTQATLNTLSFIMVILYTHYVAKWLITRKFWRSFLSMLNIPEVRRRWQIQSETCKVSCRIGQQEEFWAHWSNGVHWSDQQHQLHTAMAFIDPISNTSYTQQWRSLIWAATPATHSNGVHWSEQQHQLHTAMAFIDPSSNTNYTQQWRSLIRSATPATHSNGVHWSDQQHQLYR